MIHVPLHHQPPNPEDQDNVVPDQHAAFGILHATQPKQEPAWRDLDLEELVQKGPAAAWGGSSAGWGAGIMGRDGTEGSGSGSAKGLGLGRGLRKREGLGGGLPR